MESFHGRFVWYELMTSDPKAAEKFYREVVGWKGRDAGMPDMAYRLMSIAGGADVAGIFAIPDEAKKMGARPAWFGYIAVDDVDKSAEKLKKAGGKVHREPTDIPGVGRFAMVADPGGAAFALFSASSPPPGPPPAMGTPGTAGWRELMAADWQSAWRFYSDMFGWKKGDAMDMGPAGTYQLFNIGEEMIGGMMTKPAEAPQPYWTYYFNVDGIEAAKTRAEKGGAKILMGPMEVPGGSWVFQALDPQGAMFALVGPKG
jgi:predicted enzyme related to lactoylglutathione lyase